MRGTDISPNTAVPPRRPAPREASRAPGDEIDLLAYAAVLWRYRYLLLIVALTAGAVTYAINRRMTPTYEARFRLMGSETAIDGAAGSRLNMVAFRELVESPNLVAAVIDEFDLDRPPHNLTPQRFLRERVDVSVIRDSTIIDVAVRLQDPRLVLEVSRRYAERIVETAQRLNTEGIDFTAARIKEQRDKGLERLKLVEQALQDRQHTAQIELLRKDVDTLLARRPDALDLSVRIQGARARLQQAESELARQEKVRTVRRGVDSVGSAAPGRDEKTSRQPDDLRIRGELLDPYVNPVYEAIARDVSEYRAELAGLEQERKTLVAGLHLDSPTAAKLSRLYDLEAELATLVRDRDVARTAYLNAANQYENARLESTIRSPRLQILDNALPVEAPVAPRSLRNALAAALIALTLAAVFVLAFDASRARRGESA